jgi:two-component system nitrate/nitrite response regulator NarL
MTNLSIVGRTQVYMDALARALNEVPEINVVAAVSEWSDLLGVEASDSHVVLLESASAESVGHAQALLEARPDLCIIAIAVPADDVVVVVRLAEAGVSGFVLAPENVDDLIAAIRSFVRGEMLCSPRVAATLLRRVAITAAERSESIGSNLTRREFEVAHLVCEGLSNKEIARRLGIELHTAKNHVHNVLKKLKTHHRTEVSTRLRSQVMAISLALPAFAELLETI